MESAYTGALRGGQMKTIRLAAINQAKEAPRWGIILEHLVAKATLLLSAICERP